MLTKREQQDRELATLLHKKLCHYNHQDGCAWDYEDDWTQEPKLSYLEKVTLLREQFNYTPIADEMSHDYVYCLLLDILKVL